MRNVIFITILGFGMLSLANSESFAGDLIISDASAHNYNGLTVGGSLIISGSGEIRVNGGANVQRNFIISSSGAITVNGDATVQGNLDYRGSGAFHVTGVLTVRGYLRRHGSGAFVADGGIVN